MKPLLTIAALLIFLVQVSAEICIYDTREGGQKYLHSIKEVRAAKLPTYQPAKSNPPLLPMQACRIAEGFLKTKHPKIASFEIQEVSLRFASDTNPHLWYYFIQFVPGGSHPWDATMEHAVLVLLDGSVVEPVVSKENEKDG